MKQSVSFYRMDDDKEDDVIAWAKGLGLDGVENLTYGYTPSKTPFTRATVGCHLHFWPTWMDFYTGNTEALHKEFPADDDVKRVFGALTPSGWIEKIKENIKTALAEQPAYLVWHVADCATEEIWTKQFRYSSKEILKAAAGVFHQVESVIPDNVYCLFENIFWPGLTMLHPEEVSYFLKELHSDHVGIMLDTGHLMNLNPNLTSEEEGADFVCETVKNLGEDRHWIKGIHLSCSLSGAFQKTASHVPPKKITPDVIYTRIRSIDQHRPFHSTAAKRIIETVQPLFVTHELFGNDMKDTGRLVKIQQHAAGLDQ
jgi:hypothetical protein